MEGVIPRELMLGVGWCSLDVGVRVGIFCCGFVLGLGLGRNIFRVFVFLKGRKEEIYLRRGARWDRGGRGVKWASMSRETGNEVKKEGTY